MRNVFILADRLHKTAGEIMAMPADEFMHWMAYLRAEEKKRR